MGDDIERPGPTALKFPDASEGLRPSVELAKPVHGFAAAILSGEALAAALYGEPDEVLDLTGLTNF